MRVFREGWAPKIFQIWSETSLCISRWKKECKARTFSISLSGFLGFANVYAMRVNLSVAIVYMAGEKGMAWKESQQGFILGEIWKVLAVYWQFCLRNVFLRLRVDPGAGWSPSGEGGRQVALRRRSLREALRNKGKLGKTLKILDHFHYIKSSTQRDSTSKEWIFFLICTRGSASSWRFTKIPNGWCNPYCSRTF